jgi:hypothetical protein
MDTYRIHLIWIHLRLPPFISQKAAGSVEGRFDSTVLQQRYSTGNSNSTVGLVIAVFSAAVLEFCMLVDETSSGSLKSDDARIFTYSNYRYCTTGRQLYRYVPVRGTVLLSSTTRSTGSSLTNCHLSHHHRLLGTTQTADRSVDCT